MSVVLLRPEMVLKAMRFQPAPTAVLPIRALVRSEESQLLVALLHAVLVPHRNNFAGPASV